MTNLCLRFGFLFLFWTVSLATPTINPPKNLKVDYITQPLGLDTRSPGFSWEVGDLNRGAIQSAYQILLSASAANIDKNLGDMWDSGKIESDATIQIPYQGKPLESGTRYFWTVRTWDGAGTVSEYSPVTWFETGFLDPGDWTGEWISDGRTPPEKDEDFYKPIPVPLFRKSFTVSKKVHKARLYISGLGYYNAYLNGQKAGDHRLDPGWTQVAKTVYYSVYDVTGKIHSGQNVMGIMLGNGWYNPLPMQLFGRWNLRKILTIGQPKVLAQLHIEYENGEIEHILTDTSWKTSTGSIIRNNVYLGEWVDARLQKEGWIESGYDDRDWEKAITAEPPNGELTWQFIPPIRHTRTLYPVHLTVPRPDTIVVDMGQNFAGVIRFRVSAPRGTEIKFRYAELLYKDGTLDFRTTAATQIKEGGISGGPGAPATAWQEDRYICKGEGIEIFEPQFTFHGFRYVEITGLPYIPSLNDIVGLRLNSDLADNASFQCSNELFNKVQEVTEWTMLSNVFSIESDCPAREKFGYGGDMVTAGEAYNLNYDMATFYAKTVRDFSRDARPGGGMTECAPDIGINQRGVTEDTGPVGWTLVHPFLLEQLYRYYGNMELIKEQYQPLKDLVDFYHRHVPDHIIEVGISDHVSIDDRPVPVTSTAFYYHHVRILADFASLLGKKDDETYYTTLALEIKEAFIERFVNPVTGEVYTRTQAAQVFALYYDLLPDSVKNKAIEVLKNEIYIKHRGHLSTGIFSTKMMLNVLSDLGMDEINYTMMNQKEFPGYGYMIDNGATTLWENWAFKQHDSKNHPMFGSVSEWFYKSILGIQQTEHSVAYKEILIKPFIHGPLTWARGHYHSMRGRISCHWWKFGDDIFMNIEIPANTQALVYLPVYGRSQPDIYERDRPVIIKGKMQRDVSDLEWVKTLRNHYVLQAGAGVYRFIIRH
ncbi:Bacterial alpha-L-rhamnosidase [candidate division KSB1 bacterium]|nr:Bacterial alpha-L-rhamnosidase [candidate division KSB1 bacterium]